MKRTTIAFSVLQATAFLVVLGEVFVKQDRIGGSNVPESLAWAAKVLSFPLFYVVPDRVVEFGFPGALVVLALLNGSLWALAIRGSWALLRRSAGASAGSSRLPANDR